MFRQYLRVVIVAVAGASGTTLSGCCVGGGRPTVPLPSYYIIFILIPLILYPGQHCGVNFTEIKVDVQHILLLFRNMWVKLGPSILISFN